MHPSFSQAGEDRIMQYLLSYYLKIDKTTYLDIGTNHPLISNNTYLFYLRGGKGVCVEPDPRFYKLLKKYRSRDTILNAGVGIAGKAKAAFYTFPAEYSAWNTFSGVEADKRKIESGINYIVDEQELIDINETIGKYFENDLDILSLDAEGIDFDIIKTLDFSKYRPKVICVETVTFTLSGKPGRVTGLIDFIQSKGYFIFADTHINTIFCREDIFPQNR